MRKIMFNDCFGLTEAVLTGRKTMTRRMADVQYYAKSQDLTVPVKRIFIEDGIAMFEHHYGIDAIPLRLQPYKKDEILAVSQSYKAIYDEMEEWFGNAKANDWWCELYDYLGCDPTITPGYKNKMFVCPDFMPHHIRIKDVRCEHLQDISDEDCLREGIEVVYPYIDRNPNDKLKSYRFRDKKSKWGYYQLSPVRDCFAVLIDKVSGKGTWKLNNWCFPYTLEVID